MSESEYRRRRPPVSCNLCRSRKIRCDRGTPCSNCQRSRNGVCVYNNDSPRSQRQTLTPLQESQRLRTTTPVLDSSDTLASSQKVSADSSAQNAASLESRVRQLEEQLSKTGRGSIISPTSNVHYKYVTSYPDDGFSIYKTRMYGRSHWFNGIAMFHDLFEGIEPQINGETSRAFTGIQRCKALAKVIKSQRAPPWPTVSNVDLPVKELTDALVDCYLNTIECVYRILHIPSFRKDYNAIWMSDTQPDAAFLIQLKLVLAIGSITYDDTFSLRPSAITWIYEARNWLSKPDYKSRLNIQSLQTNILLLFAREMVNVGSELIWISAGELLRTAVYIGLHRDPTHLSIRTTYTSEMRRRLWNTILEINLQSSIVSGEPPFISLSDFDTEPPQNYDDDELVDGALPKQEEEYSQSSIASALRKTFPLRLTITKLLNDHNTEGTYQETLRLDKELRASYRILRRTLLGYHSSTRLGSSSFATNIVEILINHYLSSLHIPFLKRALHETAFAYSRKVVIEASLKIWSAAHPSTHIRDDQFSSDIISTDLVSMLRLVTSGSGSFRLIAFQAVLMIVLELKTLLQEEEGFGPIALRPDLLSVLNDAESWSLRNIEVGETNIKSYLLMSIVAAQIKGLMQGFGKDKLLEVLFKTVEDAEERCLSILKKKVAPGQIDGAMDGLGQMSLNALPGAVEGWDPMTSEVSLDFNETEPMNWLFNYGSAQESSLWQ